MLKRRLRALLCRSEAEGELDEELRYHLGRQIEQNVAGGMSPQEARRAAVRDFGGLQQAKENCRDARGVSLVEDLWQDLRFGARMLMKKPAFTTVAVLTLSLGIGACTAIFSLVDAFLLKPLQVREPQQLVILRATRPKGGSGGFSREAFEQLRDRNHALAGVFAYDESHLSITADGAPEYIDADFVSGNYFDVLGVGAALGRVFSVEDDRQGQPPVAVLSYSYWERHFGADPAAVGKTVYVGKIPVTVVGVTPPGFYGRQAAGRSADLALPLSVQPKLALLDHASFGVMGRLKPDVSAEQARADLDLIYHQALADAAGAAPPPQAEQEMRARRVLVEPGSRGTTNSDNDLPEQLPILLAVVGLLLLITCANVANLMLARAASRQKELAVRLALGASRGRLVRQLLTESVLLAGLGGALGLLFAGWGARALLAVLSYGQSTAVFDPKPDAKVLAFTAAICLLTSVAFGLAPAWIGTKIDVAPILKGGGADAEVRPRHRRMAKSFVVTQMALSLALLVGAGLLIRSLRQLYVTDMGFERDRVLTMWAFPTLVGYDHAKELRLYGELLNRLNSTPGVRSASLSRYALTRGSDVNYVGPRFFETQGIGLVSGREFSYEDGADSQRVAILSQGLAGKYFPAGNPLGQHLPDEVRRQLGFDAEVVGVVRDTKHALRQQAWDETLYMPYTQAPPRDLGQVKLHVRAECRPSDLAPSIRREIQAAERDLPLVGVQTQAEEVEGFVGEERSLAMMLSFFGGLALVLSAVGIYGTVAYSVGRRVKEIGIRVALGACPRQIAAMVLREALAQVLVGAAFGVAISLALARLLKSLLFGVGGADPLTLACVTLLLALVALLACLVPARRAARVDPMVALRTE
jgi:predicted permease